MTRSAVLLQKVEPYLFAIALLLTCREVLCDGWPLTEDGPAHLYNAELTRRLLFFDSGFLHRYFLLNPVPVPNWFGHALLLLFTFFCSPETSLILLHLVLVAGLCLSFRYLLLGINKERPWLCWLIFPFVYSTVYYFGFYNYSLGVIVLLCSLGRWVRCMKRGPGNNDRVYFFVLGLLLYFSHILALLLFPALAFIVSMISAGERKIILRQAVFLFLSLLPAGVLLLLYLSRETTEARDLAWQPTAIWGPQLFTFQPLVSLTPDHVDAAHKLAFLLYVVTGMNSFIFFLKRKTLPKNERQRFLLYGGLWLLSLALVVIIPDRYNGGSIVTARLLELSWIFLLLFIAAGFLPQRVSVFLAGCCIAITLINMSYRRDVLQTLRANAADVALLSQEIRPNSTAFVITFPHHWLMLQEGDFACTGNGCAMLSDYEGGHDYFPLRMRRSLPFDYMIGGLHPAELRCTNSYLPPMYGKPQKQIDYVLLCDELVHPEDSACYQQLKTALETAYVLRKTTGTFRLYESRENVPAGR